MSDMMASDLIGAYEELNLEMVNHVRGADLRPRHQRGNTATQRDCGCGLEGLRGGHALGLVTEINLPRQVDRGRVLEPGRVHFLDIIGRVSLEEGILCGGLVFF